MYPWLEPALTRLAAMGDQTPHALLLHGPAGIGKDALARAVARSLVCESMEADRLQGGCGRCIACGWFDRGNHPDFRRVTSEALAAAEGAEPADDAAEPADGDGAVRGKRVPSREIKIDQVRALQSFLAVATHRGRHRVVLLSPLDAVNDVAANALLKSLEEPPPRTVFVLVADQIGRVAPTILSRCHKVLLAMPPASVATAWLAAQQVAAPEAALALAGGAPLDALALARDVDAMAAHRELVGYLGRPGVEAAMATAESFARTAPGSLVRWLQLWLADCVSLRLAGRIRYHPTHSTDVARVATPARIDAMLGLMQRLESVRRTIDHPLNPRLLLEGVLIAYAEAMAPAPAR